MPHRSKDHGHAVLVGGRDHFGSRTEPPGWITAVIPAAAAESTRRGTGRKRQAITEPWTASPSSAALIAAIRAE